MVYNIQYTITSLDRLTRDLICYPIDIIALRIAPALMGSNMGSIYRGIQYATSQIALHAVYILYILCVQFVYNLRDMFRAYTACIQRVYCA